MKFYHRTAPESAQSILAGGFRDATGTYMTANEYTGVWISNIPLDENEGAWGDALLEISIDETRVVEFEWVEEGKGYREFLVPAETLNDFGKVRRLSQDEEFDLY